MIIKIKNGLPDDIDPTPEFVSSGAFIYFAIPLKRHRIN
jgi:hypothetical protein